MNPISGYREIQFGTFCRSEFNSIASKARWKIIQCRKTVKNHTKNVVGNRIYFLKGYYLFYVTFLLFLTDKLQTGLSYIISYAWSPSATTTATARRTSEKTMVLMSKQLCTCITFFGTFLSLPFTKALLMRSSCDDVNTRWPVFLSLCGFLFGPSEFNSRKKIPLDSQIDRIGIIASVAVVVAEGLYSL